MGLRRSTRLATKSTGLQENALSGRGSRQERGRRESYVDHLIMTLKHIPLEKLTAPLNVEGLVDRVKAMAGSDFTASSIGKAADAYIQNAIETLISNRCLVRVDSQHITAPKDIQPLQELLAGGTNVEKPRVDQNTQLTRASPRKRSTRTTKRGAAPSSTPLSRPRSTNTGPGPAKIPGASITVNTAIPRRISLVDVVMGSDEHAYPSPHPIDVDSEDITLMSPIPESPTSTVMAADPSPHTISPHPGLSGTIAGPSTSGIPLNTQFGIFPLNPDMVGVKPFLESPLPPPHSPGARMQIDDLRPPAIPLIPDSHSHPYSAEHGLGLRSDWEKGVRDWVKEGLQNHDVGSVQNQLVDAMRKVHQLEWRVKELEGEAVEYRRLLEGLEKRPREV